MHPAAGVIDLTTDDGQMQPILLPANLELNHNMFHMFQGLPAPIGEGL